ncbi:hypothetical protein [Vibrio sp. D431a]|uniref:hypothetical protein n=1 Tax=Vibrio sp. D431a TaxID=2837388 RepID=UPI002555A10D|nr:hypothetical protein [Vibrio sp. D431a]MDK9793878.1 hypothetical protein [Vibrio sp. D431a]
MTDNINLSEDGNTQKKGGTYRKSVVPVMNDILKEFVDTPKSTSFPKNLDEVESAISILNKQLDLLKRAQNIQMERGKISQMTKASKSMDKLINITLKHSSENMDAETVISTLKKEINTLKGEVTKARKSSDPELKQFHF